LRLSEVFKSFIDKKAEALRTKALPERGSAGETMPPVVNINGTGGKTSLMWMLARIFREYKTLVSTTTHIAVPEKSFYDCFVDYSMLNELQQEPERGITLVLDGREGKGKSIPLNVLEDIIPRFDYVFLEGDGSRTLPLKGWADYEPVFTKHTNITVGVLPLWTLGMKIGADIVHRLPLFLSLTESREGEPLKPAHFARLITGNNGREGLFKGAMGDKVLFFNQIEDESALSRAREIVKMLPESFVSGLSLIAAGSVRKNNVFTVSLSGIT